MERTPIQKFYSNSVIFITGGSGFLGTALIEKLLRTCPDIKTMYLLIRSKKNKTSEERIKDFFSDPLWNKMKILNPKYKDCVKFVTGDLAEVNMNVNIENYSSLINEVTIIFHLAATVKFDEHIKKATQINIKSTQFVLELAKQCKNLKCMIHISTAYSQCIHPKLEERFYTPIMDSEKIIQICDENSDEKLTEMTSSLIGDYPNTYTFTKSIAEDIVRQFNRKLPISVIRPSIIIGSYEDPIKGWVNNIFGPVGAMIGINMGLIRTVPGGYDNVFDLIPVDYCVNNMIAVAFNITKKDYKNSDIEIFNIVSSNRNPITYGGFYKWNRNFANIYPLSQALWVFFVFFANNVTKLAIYRFFLHKVPEFFLIKILTATRRDTHKLSRIYQKIDKLLDIQAFFTFRDWLFYDNNVKKLYDTLAPADKILFPFDVAKLEWDLYLYHLYRYVRIHFMNEPISNVDQAKKRYFKLQIAHYTVIFILLAIVAIFFYTLFNLLF